MKSNILKLILIVFIIHNCSNNSYSQSFVPVGSLLSLNDHIKSIMNDTIIKFYRGEKKFDLLFLKNNRYGDYYVNNGLALIKLHQQGNLCNPMNCYTMYLYVIFIEKNKGVLYKCAESDICGYLRNQNRYLFNSDEKEILGFMKNDSNFDFNNIVSDYNKILFLYHVISYAEIETINPCFTECFRVFQPKIQLNYPIINTKDLNLFLKILDSKGFMGFYKKVMHITQSVEREEHGTTKNIDNEFDFKYLYNKIDSLNRDFLQSYIPIIKEDIKRKRAFYLYSLPDLKLIRIRLEVKNNKLTVFRKYINPEFIWDDLNSRKVRGQKYYM